MNKFSHLNKNGEANMVDITEKKITKRKSEARGFIIITKRSLELIKSGNIGKGNIFNTSRISGILAAKKTSELIPLCHPLSIDSIDIDFNFKKNGIEVITVVSTVGKTGVEMEALTATSVACLTIYDMIKSIDKGSEITSIRLISKSGGKSGNWKRK
ncbi:MAG: cyclic pyranopterin monophosphate synthase MoaC [Pseudomonadota bacterium]|nr:cyclic pyranopterin monophosphate synthase MoaC [Pseudomonadota bacterium]MEC7831234.1 cyclic pyranopterin monophosphate synthase MoaC [Pseudomonadota bacterium]MEC9414017.1 cyclic pyranopterin monophosphate synthase MoaC [Pseudomonadota bacterium]